MEAFAVHDAKEDGYLYDLIGVGGVPASSATLARLDFCSSAKSPVSKIGS